MMRHDFTYIHFINLKCRYYGKERIESVVSG